jgi:hypothetical protein
MLFGRAAFAVAAQAFVAVVFLARSSPSPWHDAGAWMPVYGTLIEPHALLDGASVLIGVLLPLLRG